MRFQSAHFRLFSTCLLTLASLTCSAWVLNENTQVKGFISQGYLESSEMTYYTNASLSGSFAYQEAAINVNTILSDNWRVGGQLLSRRVGEVSSGKIEVDFAFVEYSRPLLNNVEFAAKLGRVKTYYGFKNATRDIPLSRSSPFPPMLYFDQIRNYMLSSDGVAITLNAFTHLGSIDFDAAVGKKNIDTNDDQLEYWYFQRAFAGVTSKNLHKTSAQLRLQPSFMNGLTLKYSYLDLNSGLFTPVLPNVEYLDIDSTYHLVSLKQQVSDFSLTIEALKAKYELVVANASTTQPFPINDARSIYAELVWQLSSNVNIFARYDRFTAVSGETDRMRGMGLSWMLTPNWLINAHYSWNSGTSQAINFADQQAYPDVRNWRSRVLQISYIF